MSLRTSRGHDWTYASEFQLDEEGIKIKYQVLIGYTRLHMPLNEKNV